MITIKNTSCLGPAQWSHTANWCFPAGQLQRILNLTSVEACQTACLLQKHCQSLDYYGDNGTCELQSQSMYWSNGDHYCLGSDHYEVLNSNRGGNRCTLLSYRGLWSKHCKIRQLISDGCCLDFTNFTNPIAN